MKDVRKTRVFRELVKSAFWRVTGCWMIFTSKFAIRKIDCNKWHTWKTVTPLYRLSPHSQCSIRLWATWPDFLTFKKHTLSLSLCHPLDFSLSRLPFLGLVLSHSLSASLVHSPALSFSCSLSCLLSFSLLLSRSLALLSTQTHKHTIFSVFIKE